jgi:hypothetical protein
MTAQEQVPAGVDTSRPSVARVYDCLLGGDDNFLADQHMVAQLLLTAPAAPRHAHNNRAFLRRVVHFLAAEAGVRQFLDIGSGLPSRGNVHEAARDITASARVVYVDNDPMVLAHGRALLEGEPAATIISGDIRQPEAILASPQVRQMTESGRPLALMLCAILHHLTDEENPGGIAAALCEALPPGSYLAISHLCNPGSEPPGYAEGIAKAEELWSETRLTLRFRDRDEIVAYFGDFELAEPGLVPLPEWRPSPRASRYEVIGHHSLIGGVARKATQR